MVGEVHGSPPQPHSVDREKWTELWEAVAHEERLDDRGSSMQGWESAEDEWGVEEVGGVDVDAKELIDSAQACSASIHAVVCWCKAMQVLVPWWRAREGGLDCDADQVHEAEGAGEDWECARCGKEEDGDGAEGWAGVVDYAVWDPSQNVEEDVLVLGEDVGQVGAVEDVLERWEDLDPDVWAHADWDEAAREEKDEPRPDRQRRQQELARNWHQRSQSQQTRKDGLNRRMWCRSNRGRKSQQRHQNNILHIVPAPFVLSDLCDIYSRVKGPFDGGDVGGRRLARMQLRPQLSSVAARKCLFEDICRPVEGLAWLCQYRGGDGGDRHGRCRCTAGKL